MTRGMRVLETDRLLLRELVPGDLDALAEIYADPEVRRFFPEGTLTSARVHRPLWPPAVVRPHVEHGRPGARYRRRGPGHRGAIRGRGRLSAGEVAEHAGLTTEGEVALDGETLPLYSIARPR